MKRREFLKQSSLALAATFLPAATTFSRRRLERRGAAQKVIIIGAGLAQEVNDTPGLRPALD